MEFLSLSSLENLPFKWVVLFNQFDLRINYLYANNVWNCLLTNWFLAYNNHISTIAQLFLRFTITRQTNKHFNNRRWPMAPEGREFVPNMQSGRYDLYLQLGLSAIWNSGYDDRYISLISFNYEQYIWNKLKYHNQRIIRLRSWTSKDVTILIDTKSHYAV